MWSYSSRRSSCVYVKIFKDIGSYFPEECGTPTDSHSTLWNTWPHFCDWLQSFHAANDDFWRERLQVNLLSFIKRTLYIKYRNVNDILYLLYKQNKYVNTYSHLISLSTCWYDNRWWTDDSGDVPKDTLCTYVCFRVREKESENERGTDTFEDSPQQHITQTSSIKSTLQHFNLHLCI